LGGKAPARKNNSFINQKLIIMVQIVGYAERVNSLGQKFFALILQSGLEMVKSKETGNYYATAKRASVASTFTEEGCKEFIGQQIPGSIQRVPCETYEFAIPATGEVLLLDHRWVYLKEGETIDAVVQEEKVVETQTA
jgi:hypothetical protein